MADPIILPPLPHPVMNAMLGDDWADLFTADQLRARDIEVARLVLEAAAKLCKGERLLGLDDERAYYGELMVDAIRKMEVHHHE